MFKVYKIWWEWKIEQKHKATPNDNNIQSKIHDGLVKNKWWCEGNYGFNSHIFQKFQMYCILLLHPSLIITLFYSNNGNYESLYTKFIYNY